ncbi:MAG: chemoreceptor glutamine deamidase CheD [Colwellia sp.]
MHRNKHSEVGACLQNCLPEFCGVNHYWDKQRNKVIAKILPGEFYMTTEKVVIATTLGSCVSACIWDDRAKIGGMNHFMLPITDKEVHEINWGQREKITDATRYGNFAMEHLINTILKCGGRRQNLKAKLFGGGKVLNQMSDVGKNNAEFALIYMKEEKIPIISSDLGDIYPRKVVFEPFSGRAFVKHLNNLHNDTIARRETDYRSKIDKAELEGDVELF